MLTGGYYLGSRAKGRTKNTPYESGLDSVGSARLRFPSKFYLVAMFFVIFDVEALFLYAWAVSVREAGWAGFIEAFVFINVLLVGLIYHYILSEKNGKPTFDKYFNRKHKYFYYILYGKEEKWYN